MNPVLYMLPLIPAIICWLFAKCCFISLFTPAAPYRIFGLRIQGFVPKYQGDIARTVAAEISKQILNEGDLHRKLTQKERLQNAMPLIEEHIDHFLNKKVPEALPVIPMFVGEKIIAQLKQLFIKELEELFPTIMSQFIGDLSQGENLTEQIVVKLTGIPPVALKNRFYGSFGSHIKKVEFLSGFIGLVAGIIQLTLTMLLQ